MKTIFDSLKSLITPELIQKTAGLLNEPDSKISNATPSILAGFLGLLLKKGHTQQINNLLDEAGNLDLISSIGHMLEGKPVPRNQELGDQFLEQIMGDRAADFTHAIAQKTGLSNVSVNGWVSSLSPVVLGFLGNLLKTDHLNSSALFNKIKEEKDSFMGFIPSDMKKTFGLDTLFQATPSVGVSGNSQTAPAQKKKIGWLWLIPILAILLGLYCWRSCGCCEKGCQADCQKEGVCSDTNSNTKVDAQLTVDKIAERLPKELTLSNGIKLNAFDGSMEDRVVQFLESDTYKNASKDVLQNKWFEFEDIDFEFGSTTKLISGQTQLDNVIAILKCYKNAKVEIAASTDKKGSEETNMKVSEARAKTIGEYISKAGVGNQVVKTIGFGEKFAEHNVSESDTDRAEDRNIALRFVK